MTPPGGPSAWRHAAEGWLLARAPLDDESRYRALVAVRAVGVCIALCLITAPAFFLIMGWTGPLAAVLTAALLGLGLLMFRLTGQPWVLMTAFGTSLSAVVSLTSWFAWGGFAGTVMVALVVPPSLAAVFVGPRAAAIWAAVSIGLVAGMLALSRVVVPPPPVVTGPGFYLTGAITLCLVIAVISSQAVLADVSRRRAAARLTQALTEAREASRVKSAFLATMSHELRTPMNGVLGMLGLLLDGPLDDEQRRRAAAAQSSGEALLVLLNELLDFAKVEAGKVTLDTVATDLERVSEDVIELLQPRTQEKGLLLAVRVAPGLPGPVMVDGARLRQVLLNLVSNAVKFTPAGHVLLDVEGTPAGDSVALSIVVEDTGIGIPPDRLAAIFEAFTQADSSTTRRFGGTGLGLTIARHIVEAMGGTLSVQSTQGEGSRFCVALTVPLAPGALRPALPGPGRHARVAVPEPMVRRLVEERLRGWGFAVGDDAAGGVLVVAADDAGQPVEPVPRGADRPRVVALVPGQQVRRPAWADAAVASPPLPSRLRDALGLAGSSGSGSRPASRGEVTTPSPAPIFTRVLLAEDDLVSQRVERSLLEKLGCRVDVVGNGREAIDMASRFPYDIIVLDCHMPELDGYQAARTIRGMRSTNAAIPIVALTADAFHGARERALEAGMTEYLSKPVRPAELRAMVEQLRAGGQVPPARSSG